jgi:hypothetical protein
MLDYLEAHPEYDEPLQRVTTSEHGGFELIAEIGDLLDTPDDAAALRGSVSRSLASYPDIPGLLFLRGLAEALVRNANLELAADNIRAGLRYAASHYRIPPNVCGRALGGLLTRLAVSSPDAAAALGAASLTPGLDNEFLRALCAACPDEIAALSAAELALRLAERCRHHGAYEIGQFTVGAGPQSQCATLAQ